MQIYLNNPFVIKAIVQLLHGKDQEILIAYEDQTKNDFSALVQTIAGMLI